MQEQSTRESTFKSDQRNQLTLSKILSHDARGGESKASLRGKEMFPFIMQKT